MKTALIFPGQGSQYTKMGLDFYEKYPCSKETYQELNHILGRNISDLIFFGEESELANTQNSQPAIMGTSIAILNAIMFENLLSNDVFQAVAGHSLGEYSAIVANGSIDFKDSVKLLEIRSKAMQECMPIGTGGMIALIGCQKEIINNAISNASKYGQVFIANDNADGQVVLSGEIAGIEYILENKKNLDIRRAIKLPVSAPFHCKLMKQASIELEMEVKKINFRNFNVPLYSNVTSETCSVNEIAELLVIQVTSKVRWREIIVNMINDGFKRFIEIGPGNVLTNLIKRKLKNVDAISISKIDDLEKLRNNMI